MRAMQGVQLAGGQGDLVGVEGAPVTLLDAIQHFLIKERAQLRREMQEAEVQRVTGAASGGERSCQCMYDKAWGMHASVDQGAAQ